MAQAWWPLASVERVVVATPVEPPANVVASLVSRSP